VLVVPLVALTTAADGAGRVEVEAPDGTTSTVRVRPGLSADGYVEVDPVEPGDLQPGDRVVVDHRD
jgi:multidrug efflux pump subunit AcrA (membrane-fusion protein)